MMNWRNRIKRLATEGRLALPLFEGTGEVQEKPVPARVGVEDADCPRGSEACTLRHG